MKILIVEDELPAAKQLAKMLGNIDVNHQVIKNTDSVEATINYLKDNVLPELIFMDIQLGDGKCFEIFEKIDINVPIIFTTAYDEFALKAFKVNSVDYLLKPIDENELKNALIKFSNIHNKSNNKITIGSIINDFENAKFKHRLLIKRGQQYNYINTENIALCYADGKLCFVYDKNYTKHLLYQNLSEIEIQLNPKYFFRINRNTIINITSISKINIWLGNRLKVILHNNISLDTIVSRERVKGFKEWLNGN